MSKKIKTEENSRTKEERACVCLCLGGDEAGDLVGWSCVCRISVYFCSLFLVAIARDLAVSFFMKKKVETELDRMDWSYETRVISNPGISCKLGPPYSKRMKKESQKQGNCGRKRKKKRRALKPHDDEFSKDQVVDST